MPGDIEFICNAVGFCIGCFAITILFVGFFFRLIELKFHDDKVFFNINPKWYKKRIDKAKPYLAAKPILVIDNEPSLLKMVNRLLSEYGYVVDNGLQWRRRH